MIVEWLQRALDLVYPPRCITCSRLGIWLCADCLTSLEPVPEPICPLCGRPIERTGRLCRQCQTNSIPHDGLDGIRSAAIHEGVLRQAIHHLKYRHRRELAAPLGEILFTYWQNANLEADLVIPVPLHQDRLKERGYNQAGLLAQALAEHAGLKRDETHLIRKRNTVPQTKLNAQDRNTNVKDAFVWTGEGLKGIKILLIDDVCTTGATLRACAAALRQAGAESIWALTLARAL